LIWGYANGNGKAQYPGPTLIVNEGDTVTVNLTNTLTDEPVSIAFPGQEGVVAAGVPGLITQEAAAGGGTASYTFVANHAGTYLYHSGTRPDLQVEMGLVGAIIVRPKNGNQVLDGQAYGHADTSFDHEYLFLLTEMDPRIHELVEFGQKNQIDTADYQSVLWFINGRNGPDTLFPAFHKNFPHQPYNSLPLMRPGEKILMRVIGAGRELHPFHTHGNNFELIARDGRVLESAPGAGPDLARGDYTLQVLPGATYDALFTWTGKGLGWDIYGTTAENPHTCTPDANGFDGTTKEWCADHNKPLPVTLPEIQDTIIGGFYSGSPFLGVMGGLPPGEGGLNPWAGFTYMWHSHTEKELTNFDVFPGGLLTMLVIVPPGTPIP
jgi:FtsP/CotA-like multicopper oxidase with cupredoxin domain